jgi:flagellar hook-length control protein FliK
MESNILQTLTGTQTASSENRTKRSDKPDGDVFSACLDDASKTKAESGKANSQLIDDNSKKKSSKKEDSHKGDAGSGAQTAASRAGVGKMTPAMERLMHINPDTLSMADKQSLRVGEFSREQEAPVQMGFGKMPASALAHAARNSGVSVDSLKAGDKLAVQDEHDVKEKKARHATEETRFLQPNLESLLNHEVKATEQVSKADISKAFEQRQHMLDQIIKHVEVRNFQNRTELSLRLNPEYLGELKFNMVHNKDGGVQTHIVTSSRLTRELLNESSDDLVKQASSKGIRLGAIKISLVDTVD